MTPQERFEANKPLVYSAIKKRFIQYQFDEDIMQEGMLGLWKACLTFKQGYGAFSTYAYPCILNAIGMQFRKKRLQTTSLETLLLDKRV